MLIAICVSDGTTYERYHHVLLTQLEKTCYHASFRKVRTQKRLLKLLETQQCQPDLILIGAQLQDADSIEAAMAIRQQQKFNGILVFVELPPERLQQAFDAQAFHCIVKGNSLPRRREILQMAIQAAAKHPPQGQQAEPETAEMRIHITERGRGERELRIKNVDYVQVHGRLLEWHCGPNVYINYGTMGSLCSKLESLPFLRVHRQVVVQTDRMQSCCRQVLTLKDGTQFKVGRTYETAVRSILARQYTASSLEKTAALRRAPAPARVAALLDG